MHRRGLILALALALVLAGLPAAAQQEAPPTRPGMAAGKGMMCPCPMCGAMMGGGMMGRGMMGGGMMGAMAPAMETLDMMAAISKRMAEKLSGGKLSAEEMKRMGQQLGRMSEAMEEMTEVIGPQEQMTEVRDQMGQMMREMGMKPAAEAAPTQ